VAARVALRRVPVLDEAWALAAEGCVPAGTHRNRRDLGDFVRWEGVIAPEQRLVLFDAQTSGGLLIAVPPERESALLAALAAEHVPIAAEIGEVTAPVPGAAGLVTVSPS
jgi:selenide,water dikinase